MIFILTDRKMEVIRNTVHEICGKKLKIEKKNPDMDLQLDIQDFEA